MNYFKLLLVSILFASCLGNPTESYELAYDFEGFEQEISLPILKQIHNAEYILTNSLNESIISSDADNFMSLAYEMKSFSPRGDETIKIDSFDFPMDKPEVIVPHDLIPNLLPASSLSIKEGFVQIHFLVGHQEDIQVEFTIQEISNGGEIWKQQIDIPYPGFIPTTIDKSFSLANHDIDLSSGNFQVQYKAWNVASEDKMLGEVHINFSEQQCQKVIASNLESYDFDPIESDIPIGFYKNGVSNDIDLASVKLNLEFDNSFGFPVNLDMINIFVSNNTGGTLSLTSPLLEDLVLNFPTMSQIGGSMKTSIVFDQNNSNLLDLLNIGPEQLSFNFVPQTVQNNNTSDPFFALDSSQITANLELEIPMELSVRSFTYTEQKPFDLNVTPLPEFENHTMIIENLSMQLKAINNMPLRMEVQYYFLDQQENIIDSLFLEGRKEIGAANLDSNFEVISASEWILTEDVDEEKINNIQDARYILGDYIIKSGMEDEPVVKLYNTDKIEFQLGTTATIKYE